MPGVECGSLASIGFSQQAHAGRKSLNDLRRPVGRAVVHDENFISAIERVLFEHARDRLLDIAFVVERVYEDADGGPHDRSCSQVPLIAISGTTPRRSKPRREPPHSRCGALRAATLGRAAEKRQ